MERGLDSCPDPPVKFDPDSWQRKILDSIDKDESVFVVAPTSAGKTFCSFYAMEKVLRRDDDGIIVYIAPTKALVNQIAAEVEARFSKSYANAAGKSVWAILTRDYRIHDSLNCQILVTVPAMLQIMLLQPNIAGQFVPRIRRVIFDEIHCIGELEGGVVWEQLLLMIPSPILALSATVGNVDELGGWLENIQKSHGHTLKTIKQESRYSDLRKYCYVPAIANSKTTSSFQHVHPLSALGYGNNNSIVSDLDLEPSDMVEAANSMSSLADGKFSAPKSCQEFFGSAALITRADALRYGSHLKETLNEWMSQPSYQEPGSPFCELMVRLAGSKQGDLAKVSKQTEGSIYDSEYWLAAVPSLVQDMDAQGFLPGLFFCYDRNLNNQLLMSVLENLVSAENAFKETDPGFIAKKNAWLKQQEQAAKLAKSMEKEKKAAADGKRSKEDSAESTEITRDSFNPYAPLDRFSYASKLCGLTLDEIREGIEKLDDMPPFFVEGLKRGICVHHAGTILLFLLWFAD
ncbi:hypothetical protein HDU81_009537 [Chytriomyces hyalinus]|nr:hypothetical protein HDU81_009537 [Chytriomyces hyalinus]